MKDLYQVYTIMEAFFLTVNATKAYQIKAKAQKLKFMHCVYVTFQNNLQLIVWKKNKKTPLKGVVKLFSVDFNPIDTNSVLDIHILDLLRKYFLHYSVT